MNNKLQIIKTSDYILAVSDEEIKLSNDNIGFFLRTHSISNNLDIIQNPSFTSNYKYKKIIAYEPKGNAPELDLPLLSEMVVEEDVEKLACDWHKKEYEFLPQLQIIKAFVAGHNSATKVYSEGDLMKAIMMSATSNTDFLPDRCEEIIQSIKHPKTPKWFVAEIVPNFPKMPINGKDFPFIDVLKTTTINGKTYLVGTYKYE